MRRILYGLVSALLLAACDRGTTAPNDKGWTYNTTVSPSTFRVGQTTTVIVTATNRSNRPQLVNAYRCPRSFVVTSPSGTQVGPAPENCFALLTTRTIAPGEQFADTEQWSGDAIGDSLWGAPPRLPAGDYFVRASATATGALNPFVSVTIMP
jgi:hypothetical protein